MSNDRGLSNGRLVQTGFSLSGLFVLVTACAAIVVRTRPLWGMPWGMTTSKAETRSEVTNRRCSASTS